MPHRTEPHSSSGRPNKRTLVEYMSPLPIPNSPPYFSGGDLPIMRPTPPWLKRRKNQPELPTPPPPPLPSYALPPLEIISVPPQAKYLTVTPPDPDEEEEAVLRARVPRTKRSKAKGKPPKLSIQSAQHPSRGYATDLASVYHWFPALSYPPNFALYDSASHSPFTFSNLLCHYRTTNPFLEPTGRAQPPYFTGTPYSPEQSPYIDPGLSKGIPRALGMQAFPIRAERPWRHGG
ncbi:hypothetical protein B0H14DRAFT_3889993 [Mycena olivaceomarginata]|nr:hypothetical protein B0H14DRAFT_3889993 [Mycena olivaceomarginata]